MPSHLPNILVTGTPGTGKTSMCQLLAHVNVGDLVKERELHEGRDEEFDCFVLDEDKVCDEMEDMMTEGGKIVDFHTCDFFPERWFDLVLVLRVDNTTLFDRLQKRGYSEKKVAENVECEIMQVVLQEAMESYAHEIVQELESRTVEDMDANIERVVAWIQQWVQDHASDN
ncbi:adenylate kinase, partial [Globisporangium splendens]